MPAMFIGLGPNGQDISEDQLREFLEQFVPVSGIRMRGTCAFADVGSDDDAQRLIAGANDQMLGNARLAVQVSRPKGAPAGGDRRSGPVSLFIGLGPQGDTVSDDLLRSRLEEAAPVSAIRRRGQCAFVDVSSAADAERMINRMRNAMIGECRLSVQYSKDKRNPEPMAPSYDDRGKRGRDDSRDRRDRRRSDSRDRRDRRRSDSRDRRRRSDSRDRRDRRRDDSRDRRRRSPSY